MSMLPTRSLRFSLFCQAGLLALGTGLTANAHAGVNIYLDGTLGSPLVTVTVEGGTFSPNAHTSFTHPYDTISNDESLTAGTYYQLRSVNDGEIYNDASGGEDTFGQPASNGVYVPFSVPLQLDVFDGGSGLPDTRDAIGFIFDNDITANEDDTFLLLAFGSSNFFVGADMVSMPDQTVFMTLPSGNYDDFTPGMYALSDGLEGVNLIVTEVPEPSTYALALGAIILAGATLRRARQR